MENDMASAQAERYLASLPIEDQQAIRAGGDVDAWYQAAVAAGAVPGQGGAPASTPAGGWANASAQEAGINPWQQDYKQEFGRTSSQALAQMSPEQRARWSMEHLDAIDWRSRESAFQQWMAWQDSFDPSCPSNAPYRAGDGSGCVEKPDNSNAGYQQGAEGGGGGAGGGRGGRGGGLTNQQTMSSPLMDMLKNQGGFLGGYDPTRGDSNPGVRGGVAGGGSIWWQPTQTLARPAGPSPATAPGSVGWNDPNIASGGQPLAGAQSWGGAGAGSAKPGLLPTGGAAANSVGWNNPNLPSSAQVMPGGQSWGGAGARQAPGPSLAPGGANSNAVGWNNPNIGSGGALTGVMAGLQGQGRRFDPLGSMMTPFQKKVRTGGSWFGG